MTPYEQMFAEREGLETLRAEDVSPVADRSIEEYRELTRLQGLWVTEPGYVGHNGKPGDIEREQELVKKFYADRIPPVQPGIPMNKLDPKFDFTIRGETRRNIRRVGALIFLLLAAVVCYLIVTPTKLPF